MNSLSDEFNYNENIFAGYLSLSKDWDTWSIKAGLRGEYTDIEGQSNSVGIVNTQEYFELFPTFYLMQLNTPEKEVRLFFMPGKPSKKRAIF